MTWQELFLKYQAKLAEAQALVDAHKDGMPEDVAKKCQEIMGEADQLKAQAEMLKKLKEGKAYMEDPANPPKASASFRAAAPGEGDFPIDGKAWQETEVNTPFGKKIVRFNTPLVVQHKEYAPAFEAYMRKGSFIELGSNDRKALSEGVDTAGGYLVPVDVQSELISKMASMAVIRSLARVISTSRDVVSFVRKTYTTNDIYTGPARITWTAETPSSGSVHRVTNQTFGQVDIPINTAMASQLVSNNLIEDSAFDVMSIVTQDLAEAFALGEDNVFINGTGANQPKGILTDIDTAGKGPTKTVSGGASTLTADGLLSLWGSLPSQYHGANTRWVMALATLLAIKKLKDGSNRYLLDTLNTGSLQSPVAQILVDRPVLLDEFMPAIAANAYPIIFGDFSGYMIADRVGLSVQILKERYAEENQTLVLGRKRVGGQVVEDYKIKVQKVSA